MNNEKFDKIAPLLRKTADETVSVNLESINLLIHSANAQKSLPMTIVLKRILQEFL